MEEVDRVDRTDLVDMIDGIDRKHRILGNEQSGRKDRQWCYDR